MEVKTRRVNTVTILELNGRFDSHTVPPIRDILQEVVLQKPAYIVVNLESVNFIDSAALSTLVSGMKQSRQGDGDLRLCNLQQPVRMIFEMTRLDRVFEIISGEEEAVESFNNPASSATNL